MAQALREMYARAGKRWIIFAKTNEDLFYQRLLAWNFTKLPCWDLIEWENRDGMRGGRKRWRLTPLGASFVTGKEKIPMYVRIMTGTGNAAFGRPFGPKIFIGEVRPWSRAEVLREST